MTKDEFLGYLHDGDFRQLFLECFWSNPSTTSPYRFQAGEETYEVQEVAQKGLKVFVCRVERIPDSSVRRLIDAKLRKLSHDYFMVFVSTSEPFHHLWSVPVKTVDKRTLVTVEYDKDDQALFLLEKMNAITFSLDEDPTVIDVANRVNAAFLVNTTEVTKKFYQSFRKQHDMFVKGIENITGKDDREWYASVMLNRLMFCYFIQKKRFLNFDENYLGNKLRETQARKGRDKFYESFYRSFLKQLFSDGLDKPVAARSDYFIRKYGRIPYLNGGMFSMHQIEKENKDIDIPDKVFERLFAFFDEWHWHLDNRITASGRDINPDVLGYIFEQYINDRAQMGAYYTKEDITEYIGRNTIIPWVWIKAVGNRDLGEFLVGLSPRDSRTVGSRVPRDRIDRYIFPAMRKGLDLPLPPDIAKGVPVEPQTTLRARRANWNKPADEKYALPTEIWRETVARRQRCEEIRSFLGRAVAPRPPLGRDGSPSRPLTIHDFITYNLDIRTFVEDVIRDTSDHKLVLHFYKALREVTILDPTCGSGAFLFAALNILEPLYEACLDRMEEFHAKNSNLFKDELAEMVGRSPRDRRDRQYFIYKSIILRNLYGVDIMHEATEIARLRLFLKMVAVVDVDEYDPNLGLDPLPDIDFNIRCGNTLVGYASEKEIENALVNGDMFAYAELKGKIDTELGKASMAFDFFRREQLNLTGDRQQLVAAKEEIHKRLAVIRKLLDDHLYASSGSLKKKDAWLRDTQPFHWYTEFYPIMHGRGGFDVIIGNPPYVEYNESSFDYTVSPDSYITYKCKNLHAYCVERSYKLSNNKNGGMILPIGAFTTVNMKPLIDFLDGQQTCQWISSYHFRPGHLFEGAHIATNIFLTQESAERIRMSTGILKFNANTRDNLFPCISYVNDAIGFRDRIPFCFPKLSNDLEYEILCKVFTNRQLANSFSNKENGNPIEYRSAGGLYWKIVINFPFPYSSTSNKKAYIRNSASKDAVVCFLNSSLQWLFYCEIFDTLNFKDYYIKSLPFDGERISPPLLSSFGMLCSKLMRDYRKNAVHTKRGNTKCYNISANLSKPIIDEIDELLAKHYGFTEEELDFIINYDIKYRMGDELNAET